MSLILMQILLLLSAAQSRANETANCNDNVSLPCPGVDTIQFVSVTWYKVEDEKKGGLITKRQGHSQPYHYSPSALVMFGENHSLMLLKVTPEDSGRYECAINAKIGGRNLNVVVELAVNVCPTQASTVGTNPANLTEELEQEGAEELPLLWSLVGCGALGLSKILFSLVTVQVVRAVGSSRRWRDHR